MWHTQFIPHLSSSIPMNPIIPPKFHLVSKKPQLLKPSQFSSNSDEICQKTRISSHDTYDITYIYQDFLVIYSYFIVIVINITYDIPIYSYLNHGICITASQGLVTSLGRATKRWLGTCLATEVVRWLWRIPWEKKTPFFDGIP